jgi:hypothetical protein
MRTAFLLICSFVVLLAGAGRYAAEPDLAFGTFEGKGYSDWTTTGEAFVNGGVVDVSGVSFPDLADPTRTLTAEGGTTQINRLVVHELRSVGPADESGNDCSVKEEIP